MKSYTLLHGALGWMLESHVGQGCAMCPWVQFSALSLCPHPAPPLPLTPPSKSAHFKDFIPVDLLGNPFTNLFGSYCAQSTIAHPVSRVLLTSARRQDHRPFLGTPGEEGKALHCWSCRPVPASSLTLCPLCSALCRQEMHLWHQV